MGWNQKKLLLALGILGSVAIVYLRGSFSGDKSVYTMARKPESEVQPREEPPGFLHVVVFIPIRNVQFWTELSGKTGEDVEQLKKRQEEYVDCLRSNSENPIVAKVHVLCDNPELLLKLIFVERQLNRAKILVTQVPESPDCRHIFQHASDFLQNELVLIANGDNLIGEGFDAINVTWWKSAPRKMYALTRHRLKNRPADCQTSATGYCDPEGSNIGSHDGFLFHMKNPLPENFLKELEYKSDSLGAENVVIWGFQTILHYHVTNPCRRLFIYHHHCSNVRPFGSARKRVNINGKSGVVDFSY